VRILEKSAFNCKHFFHFFAFSTVLNRVATVGGIIAVYLAD
jgi:hypothetical protein